MRPVERVRRRRAAPDLRWLIVALFLALGLHGVMAAAPARYHAAPSVVAAAASHEGCCDGCLCGKSACCDPCNAGTGLMAEAPAIAAPPRPIDGIGATPMPRSLSLRPPLSPPRDV